MDRVWRWSESDEFEGQMGMVEVEAQGQAQETAIPDSI